MSSSRAGIALGVDAVGEAWGVNAGREWSDAQLNELGNMQAEPALVQRGAEVGLMHASNSSSLKGLER